MRNEEHTDTDDALPRRLGGYGLLAASVHNTQAWLVSIEGDRLIVSPDRTRQLGADPSGRELFLTLGCFWGNVRVAARALGVRLQETLSRESVDILIGGGVEGTDDALLSAIRSRRNNRFPLVGPVPDGLASDQTTDGIEVHVITEREPRSAVARIAADAFAANAGDPRFRAELSEWLRSNTSSARDGMPGYTMGVPTLLSYAMPLLVRFMSPRSLVKREYDLMAGAPAVVALCGADEPETWIQAGRMFQELAVHLQAGGITTALNASAIEVPARADELARALRTTKRPLALFRAGRPTKPTRATPRRRLQELVASV